MVWSQDSLEVFSVKSTQFPQPDSVSGIFASGYIYGETHTIWAYPDSLAELLTPQKIHPALNSMNSDKTVKYFSLSILGVSCTKF